MRIWKNFMLLYIGGMTYYAMELSWRGWSHGSMFLLGGLCFLLLGKLGHKCTRLRPTLVQLKTGWGGIAGLKGVRTNCHARILKDGELAGEFMRSPDLPDSQIIDCMI